MGEHLEVKVEDHPAEPEAAEPCQPVPQAVEFVQTMSKYELPGSSSSMTTEYDKVVVVVEDNEDSDEQAFLIGIGDCRICQEEDSLNNLETPCACSGSLKYAHRKCVQHWCNEKGDTKCEICHQPYQPGYTAPPRPASDETSIDVEELWQLSGSTLEDVHDPRLRAIADAERRLIEAEFDDYSNAHNSLTSICRSAIIILLTLMLLRHAISISSDEGDEDDNASAFFSLFVFRAVGFFLPFYGLILAISILQERRQRQEAAATRFAVVVQAAQNQGLLVPSSAAAQTNNPQLEQV